MLSHIKKEADLRLLVGHSHVCVSFGAALAVGTLLWFQLKGCSA